MTFRSLKVFDQNYLYGIFLNFILFYHFCGNLACVYLSSTLDSNICPQNCTASTRVSYTQKSLNLLLSPVTWHFLGWQLGPGQCARPSGHLQQVTQQVYQCPKCVWSCVSDIHEDIQRERNHEVLKNMRTVSTYIKYV